VLLQISKRVEELAGLSGRKIKSSESEEVVQKPSS
jgi:hypothetical protein